MSAKTKRILTKRCPDNCSNKDKECKECVNKSHYTDRSPKPPRITQYKEIPCKQCKAIGKWMTCADDPEERYAMCSCGAEVPRSILIEEPQTKVQTTSL